MKGLTLIAFSVAFLGFLKRTEGWCGLLSSASPLLSSSSCFAASSRQRHVHGDRHQRSATLTRLAAAAESNSDEKSAEINIEAIKSELTEYLKKRKEMNADDVAKLYVRYIL
jgi:pantothenate synthetase